MGGKKPLKKFAVKKVINTNTDQRLKPVQERQRKREEQEAASKVRHVQQVASSLFFKHNTALVPPYQVILDTNFINFSVQKKLDIIKSMMDSLYAECTPCVTDCVMGELEKMGSKYRVALRLARDPRFERLPCMHKGTYADDCIVERVTQHRCYLVATCDKGLKQRLRKIPGVPIVCIAGHKYTVEQMPEAYGVIF